jgi:large subunit ribosomal protein L10e
MATLRKGKCYKNVTRAYTRKSKFRKKSFITAVPDSKIVRYNMGDLKRKFKYNIKLVTKQNIQLRHNALESARLVVNRHLDKALGHGGYFLQINIYPHHVLRENKMLSGAHADRLQTGMSHSFGKPVGLAAQAKKGSVIMTASVDDNSLGVGKEAVKKAVPRLPGKFNILIEKK